MKTALILFWDLLADGDIAKNAGNLQAVAAEERGAPRLPGPDRRPRGGSGRLPRPSRLSEFALLLAMRSKVRTHP
jgi:hypothetical protein